MMNKRDFVILTDVNADLPTSYTDAENIGVISMSIQIDGKSYEPGKDIDADTFYKLMREGKEPTTAAANPHQYEQAFKQVLDSGKDVLYLAFSSALSSSYQSAVMAREMLEDKDDRTGAETVENLHFPRIVIIDTLSGSMGQGLLVYKANELKKQGKSLDEVVAGCETNKRNICHEFVLDDLMYMHRGGRLSKNSAILGSLLHVKPLIYLDDESKVLSSGHVRGSKKAIRMLIERMTKCMESKIPKDKFDYTGASKLNCADEKRQKRKFENQDMIMICHSDCEQLALQLKEQITKKFKFENIMIHTAGPVIGCHAGPGAVGVFFMGER